jgi:putative membrane protein
MKSHLLIAGCAAVIGLLPIAARADDPPDFLRNAIERDNSEIMLGRLAERRAQSQAVRDFAEKLIADNTQAREQATALAEQLGVPVPEGPTNNALDERNNLMGLHGRDFDHEFVRHMIDDHNEGIDQFRDEVGDDHGAVGGLAAQQLPALHANLEMARMISQDEGWGT